MRMYFLCIMKVKITLTIGFCNTEVLQWYLVECCCQWAGESQEAEKTLQHAIFQRKLNIYEPQNAAVLWKELVGQWLEPKNFYA